MARANANEGGTVVSVNLDTLRQAHSDTKVRRLLDQSELRIADGMPVLWAGRIAGVRFPERVAGSSLVPEICESAAREGASVFLLGGAPGVAQTAAHTLQRQHPDLIMAGSWCPPYGFESDDAELEAIERQIASAQPDIVFVGLGFPKQERLIERLRPVAPQSWFVSCGITFSFISGDVRRAPDWVQRAGLEWLHRCVQEPSRLVRRYFVDDLPFLWTLLGDAISARRARR